MFNVPQIVYHGTSTKHILSIQKINLSICSKFADFGNGFYTTTNYNQALSWAKKRAKDYNLEEYKRKELNSEYQIDIVYPLVITYYVNIKKIQNLNRYIFYKPDEKWAEFIYNNRIGKNNLISDFHNWEKQFDFVYGHIADSNIAPLIKEAKCGKICIEEFYNRIRPYNIKEDQLSFNTENAIDCLSIKNMQVEGGVINEKRNTTLY